MPPTLHMPICNNFTHSESINPFLLGLKKYFANFDQSRVRIFKLNKKGPQDVSQKLL